MAASQAGSRGPSGPTASAAAAAAVDDACTTSTPGKCSATQPRVCAAACGWVATIRTSAHVVPGRTSSENATGTVISCTIINGCPCASSSSVTGTDPSTEFSIGTTACSAVLLRTASSATVTVEHGWSSAPAAPGSERSACSV